MTLSVWRVIQAGLLATLTYWSSGASAQQVVAPERERFVNPYDQSRGVVSYADYLEKALKSVVKIYSGKYDAEKKRMVYPGHGSGVIYDARRGLVMTNEHVVDDAEAIYIELYDGELIEGELIGADPLSDIAVVRAVRALSHESKFIDTNTLRVGDLVFAVGFPKRYDKTVSAGIISGLSRRGYYNKIDNVRIEDFIQTDAAINTGNSGGPLFDSRGRVTGINTWIHRDSDGLGFAVPSNVAVAVAKRLVSGVTMQPGWFGARVDSLYPTDAKRLGLKTIRGVIVLEVEPNSPAMAAGIAKGDIITGAGGREIADKFQFANFILLSDMGIPYTVYFSRDQKPQKTRIVLTDQNGMVPGKPASTKNKLDKRETKKKKVTKPTTPQTFFGASIADNASGKPEIIGVKIDSRAFSKGLKVGDQILRINNLPTINSADLLNTVTALNGKSAAYSIKRNSSTFNLIF